MNSITFASVTSIGRSVVCFGLSSCSLPYNSSPPYLCFPFVGKWYAYNRSRIKCGSYFFTITIGVFNIKAFSATNEMCSLVWTQRLDHFISLPPNFFPSIQVFIFWVHRWNLDHSLSHLWLKIFMKILGWYLISLCL
jgi:hypothetical protein